MNFTEAVQLSIEGDEIVVKHQDLLTDRDARIMFRSVLGALATEDGWRCPRRRSSVSALAIRINTFLESHGWKVERVGEADEAVQRAIEQSKSFERTRDNASRFRSGDAVIDIEQVRKNLLTFGWNNASRTLKLHQEQGLLHGLAAINAANFSVPGSGKTATTLAVAATHLSQGTIDVILVVGPLSCFDPWEREVHTAIPTRITPIRVRGNRRERRTIYQSADTGQLLLLSYATAAADRVPVLDLCKAHRVMLIVDESHRIKRFRGGVWAPALMEIASQARIRFILSGTPMPQTGRDLYSQLNILWPSNQLTGPRDRFASEVDRDFSLVLTRIRPFVSRAPKSALGLPPYETIVHNVPMTGTQREIYELIESNFRRRLEDAASWQEKIDALKRGRPIRLLQAATNPDLLNKSDSYYQLPRVDASNPTLMERLARFPEHHIPDKFEVALDLLKSMAKRNEKVVCWSNFVPNLDQFAALVRSTTDILCFQIDGRVPVGDAATADDPGSWPQSHMHMDTRERIISDFLDCEGPAVLITNPASCSESISLHRSCHNAIYLDRTYDSALFLQSVDRIHRLGLDPNIKVTIHILLATIDERGTIDHLLDQSLLRKESRMKQLLEGAEIQPLGLSDEPWDDAEGDADDLGNLLRYLLGEEVHVDGSTSF